MIHVMVLCCVLCVLYVQEMRCKYARVVLRGSVLVLPERWHPCICTATAAGSFPHGFLPNIRCPHPASCHAFFHQDTALGTRNPEFHVSCGYFLAGPPLPIEKVKGPVQKVFVFVIFT